MQITITGESKEEEDNFGDLHQKLSAALELLGNRFPTVNFFGEVEED